METVKDILWPIVVAGGLGRFIDFLIGKAGQERAKDFLLRWWVRFDDVHWKNFGREEGLFAGRLIEQLLGRKIWSLRRIKAFVVLLTTVLLLSYLIDIYWSVSITCHYCNEEIYYTAIALIAYFICFSISVSFTKFVTFRMAYLCGLGNVKNLIIFSTMLIVNFLILVIWSPITAAIRESFLHLYFIVFKIPPINVIDMMSQLEQQWTQQLYMPDNIAFMFLPQLPSLFRFGLAIVFVGSFLLRPLVIRPLNLVWRRIVESGKPVFTLILGGAAAFAAAVSEAAKHL